MVVKSVKKAPKRSKASASAKRLFYKVTAKYTAYAKTKAEADNMAKRVSANPKIKVLPVRKTSSGYSLTALAVYYAPNVTERDKAAKGARSQGAAVSIAKVRV